MADQASHRVKPVPLPMSCLFVPGFKGDRFEKALLPGTGRVTLDPEDAVDSSEKDTLIRGLSAAVPIHLNCPDSPWLERGELTIAGLLGRLDATVIANTELRSASSIAEHPLLAARNRWIEVGIPGGGRIGVLRPPVISREQGTHLATVPAIGECTELIKIKLRNRKDD